MITIYRETEREQEREIKCMHMFVGCVSRGHIYSVHALFSESDLIINLNYVGVGGRRCLLTTYAEAQHGKNWRERARHTKSL